MQPSLRSHRIHIHWALLIIRQPLEQKRKLANYLLSAAALLAVFVLHAACFCLLARSFSCTSKAGCHLPYLWSPVKKKKERKKEKEKGVDTWCLVKQTQAVVLQKPLHIITTDWRLLLTLCLIDYFTLCFCYPLSPDTNWSFMQNVFCKQEKTL